MFTEEQRGTKMKNGSVYGENNFNKVASVQKYTSNDPRIDLLFTGRSRYKNLAAMVPYFVQYDRKG